MTKYRFIAGEPEDGQLVMGVVYYCEAEAQIHKTIGLVPIGYVAKVETEEFRIGNPELDDDYLLGEPEMED